MVSKMLLFHCLRKIDRKFSFFIFANDNKWHESLISQVNKQKEDLEMRRKYDAIVAKVGI